LAVAWILVPAHLENAHLPPAPGRTDLLEKPSPERGDRQHLAQVQQPVIATTEALGWSTTPSATGPVGTALTEAIFLVNRRIDPHGAMVRIMPAAPLEVVESLLPPLAVADP
jgi:hypothetical protein